MLAIKSHFDGKAFAPDEPVSFRSGEIVILHVESAFVELGTPNTKPHFLDWVVENLVEKADLPADGSKEHDHCIYGSPRQNPPSNHP